jgi:hypothetical protein
VPNSCYGLLQRQFRKRRGNRLLKLLANYDYACFRCPQQRLHRNALRVGISPDATLAYIDFLYDEEKCSSKMKPLCPLGQVRLPASFQMAGLGTYCTPFVIDTNDLILQAVPQTDIPSSFINTAWISFIVELNTVLRTVHKDSLYFGIRRLLRFLSDPQHVVNLGGLVVEFCTFANEDALYQSEADEFSAESETLAQLSAPQNTPTGTPDRMQRVSRRVSTHREERRNNSWERWIMKQRYSERSAAAGSSQGPSLHSDPDRPSSNMMVQPSMDMAFSSPQLSLDHREPVRESFVQKSSKKVTSCFGCLLGCLSYAVQFCCVILWHCHSTTVHLDDPVGATLSFLEMCEAIRQGRLKMGIVVTHPKVAEQTYQVQDDDYESDEDAYYLDDAEPREAKMSSVDSGSMHSVPQLGGLGISASDGKAIKPHLSAKASSALRRTYGDKADEVAKFYNIMVAADSSIAAANRDSTGTAQIAGTPKMPSMLASLATPAPHVSDPHKPPQPRRASKTSGNSTPTVDSLPPQEYTDLSPFRALRRGSKGATRDSMVMNPRTSECDMSTDGRLTDDRVSQFEPFPHHQEGDGDGVRSSRASSQYDGSQFEGSDASGQGSDGADADVNTPAPEQRKTATFTRPPSTPAPATLGRGSELLTQNTPVTLDRKSIAAREMKRRDARRTRKDLSKESLAASAFQHPVNVWRLTADQECVSDGLLRLETSKITESGRSQSDNSGVSSAAQSSAGNYDERLRMASVIVRAGDAAQTPTTATSTPVPRTPTIGSPAVRAPRTAKSAQSPWYDIRSFIGATSSSKSRHNSSMQSMSQSEERSQRSQRSVSNVSSDLGSVVNDPGSAASNRSDQHSQDLEAAADGSMADAQRESQIQRFMRRGNAVASHGYRPFYFLRLMLFYVRSVMLGSNASPLGPKYLRKLFELLIFVLCIVDFAVTIIVLTSAYCASDNTTDCKDHTSMILMLTVWPGALFIAPLMGLVTVVLGPSSTLARIYASWSRIACINSAMVLWSLFYYFSYYYNVPGSIYGMVILPSSRLVQCLIVDQYIAHIEKLRFTRGWDGLHTSLYKTQDNLQEVTI